MPTRTSNGTGGGLWSAGSTWQGGVAPVDGDSVVIAAGDAVTLDADLSGWANGVAGLTITGVSSGTPGKLTCPTANGTYVLPIKTGTVLAGTNHAIRGQLYAGSAGTPLPNGAKFTIMLKGTGQINRTYLDVRLYCAQPTYQWVKLIHDEASGQTVLHVDTDLTPDIWADGDVLAICNVSSGCDYQRTTIAVGGVTEEAITVVDALDSLNVAGSYVVRVTRNVTVTSEGSQLAITGTAGTNTGGVWNCSIRQTGSIQGYAVAYGIGDTFGGVINGFAGGVNGGVATGHTISGCVAGCTFGISTGYGDNYGHTISGLIAGCSNAGVFSLHGGHLSGIVAGCLSGLRDCTGQHISGQVVGCYQGLERCNQVRVSGSVNRCGFGVMQGSGRLLREAVIGGSGTAGNSYDMRLYNGVWRGYGAGLRSTNQMIDYLNANPYPIASAIFYDVADASGNPQPGRMKWWNCGGYGASEDWVLGTHGDPPVPLVYVHKHTFETAGYENWVEVPVWGEKNVLLVIKVYVRKQQNGMTATPQAKLCDPSRPMDHASEALATATMADNTDWQTLILSHTPAHDRQLELRVGGKNGSGTMYWDFDVRAGGRRPRLRLMGV